MTYKEQYLFDIDSTLGRPEIGWYCDDCKTLFETWEDCYSHLIWVHHYPEEDAEMATIPILAGVPLK